MAISFDQWANEKGIQTQPKPQPKKDEGFQWSSLISEGGGLAGGLGGAAAGAAAGSVIPGLGTVLGGLIGGGIGAFAGGFGGDVAEQTIQNKGDVGKTNWGGALGEGALEGVFGAGPLRLLKLGKAAKTIAGAAKEGGGQAALQTAENALAKPGLVSRIGANLRGGARGIKAGEKIGGDRIGPSQSKQLNQFIENTIGAKKGSATKQLEKVESFIGKQGDELSNLINTSNRTLTTAEKKSLINTFRSTFDNEVLSANPRQVQIFDDLIKRIGKAKTVKEVDAIRKIADGNVRWTRSSGAPEPGAEQVYKMFRNILTDDVATKVGGSKAIKSNMHQAFNAQEMLLNKASKGSGFNPAGVPVSGSVVQSSQNLLGRVAGRTGKMLSPETTGGRLAATGGRVLAGNQVQDMFTPPDQSEFTAEPTDQIAQDNLPEIGAMESPEMSGMSDMAPSQSQQLTQGLQQAALQALSNGDTEGLKNIMSVADMFTKLGIIGADVGADSEKQAKMQSAKGVVDNLMQLYDTAAGGPQGVYAGNVTNLLGGLNIGGQGNEQARAYEENRNSYLTPIIKAFGEVGVLTDKDREVVAAAIPSITDTPAQAEQKRQLLYRMLETLGSGGGGSGGGLESAISSMIQQQIPQGVQQ